MRQGGYIRCWAVIAVLLLWNVACWAAITERYVSSAAGGGGDGSSGSPWTWAEMLSTAAAGDRCNAYGTFSRTTSTDAFTNAGTAASPIIVRGCSSGSTITDGYQGRGGNGAGDLVTTNFAIITYTSGSFVPGKGYIRFECLSISATARTGSLFVPNLQNKLFACTVSNAGDNFTTTAITTANTGVSIIDCDITVSGASHRGAISNAYGNFSVNGCRIKAPAGSGIRLDDIAANVANSQIYDCVNGILGIGTGFAVYVTNTTFQSCTDALLSPDSALTRASEFVNCHITDCGQAFDSGYVATANLALMAAFTRTRDNTSTDAGFPDWPLLGSVTTDTGGPETDYADVSTDDYRLINGAPGADAGVFAGDIGSVSEIEAAGGGDTWPYLRIRRYE